MSDKIIEVELRGPLDPPTYQRIIDFLRLNSRPVSVQNRLLLDFTTFIEGIGERKIDVRIRRTNGKLELIIKKGKFGGTSREEVSIFPEGNSLSDSLRFMNMLGYSKAVACDRRIERYQVGEIEIAIQDVNDYSSKGTIHSRFFEAEIICYSEEEKEPAVEKIRFFLQANGLAEFSEAEWNSYVAKMNTEANGVFDYTTDSLETLSPLGM